MTGDFLVGNRLIYGLRTPDWIGIPYTDIGFELPYLKFPRFKEPQAGDVIIFKFPRDVHQKYVKRCVAGPGDEIQVRNRDLYVNGTLSPLAKNGKYIGDVYSEFEVQKEIFLGNQGNKDFFHSLIIPRKGDIINVSPENAILLLHLMLLDGHEITLKTRSKTYTFTMVSPAELARRKGVSADNKYYPFGNLLNPWSSNFPSGTLLIDGKPVQEMSEYIVEQNYFWAMGDNRDDSLDSRFWGFVPESHILGKALFAYFSLNLDTWIPRFNRIGTIIN
ncbi:MAG: signal peptidase I, partial [Candidatus Neomarinimicrobiota bacterium]